MDKNYEISWNLGLWRGERGLRVGVPLSPSVNLDGYMGGYNYGRTLAASLKTKKAA